jgi:hypothetical protein
MSILSAGFRLGGRELGFGLLGRAPCCNKWVMFDELGSIWAWQFLRTMCSNCIGSSEEVPAK